MGRGGPGATPVPSDSMRRSAEAEVGLEVIDTTYPQDVWVVVQSEAPGVGGAIYIKRVRDGRLFHHSRDSWRWAFQKGYLIEAPTP